MNHVKDCSACVLRKGCTQVVVGSGNLTTDFMIVGESPSIDEDLNGIPFSERAGLYLEKILLKSGIKRKEIYTTYAVKCHTKSALPQVSIDTCKKWLWQEIKSVKPKFIITMGAVPTKLLLKLKNFQMKDVVGKEHSVEYISSKIIPWYSVNYLLKQGKWLDEKTIEIFKEIYAKLV